MFIERPENTTMECLFELGSRKVHAAFYVMLTTMRQINHFNRAALCVRARFCVRTKRCEYILYSRILLEWLRLALRYEQKRGILHSDIV